MPIRFDSDNHNNNNNRGGGNPFGGSDSGKKAVGILAILGIIFFIFRKPKLFFTLVLIGGGVAGYFYWKDPEQFKQFFNFSNTGGGGNDENAPIYGYGCNIDQAKYDKAEVFEPLAASSSKNQVPSRMSLRRYAPRRLSQGQQGSCVGWASAYAARTILHASATGADPNSVAFSAAYLYNQIALPGCEGSYMVEAMKTMKSNGGLFLSKFPYDESSCERQPSSSQTNEARSYRTRGYNRLTKSGDDYDVDMAAVKQNIAQGGPVVIAFKVPPSFQYLQDKVWEPSRNEANRVDDYGGHAMCLIGYDDNYEGGAFEIMNSWGTDWGGDDGCFWIRYDDFHTFVREAYGLYPDAKAKTVVSNKIEVSFGLIDLATNSNMPLDKRDGKILYGSEISAGDKFVVEVTNSVECYIYIFGQETDGSSYTLFPYTEKHSPYCGIVGTRHFPNENTGERLKADNLGDEDYMAVVVTKNPIDYQQVNEYISNASGSSYQYQVLNGLSDAGINVNKTVKFSTNGDVVKFKGDTSGGDAVALVFEFDKSR